MEDRRQQRAHQPTKSRRSGLVRLLQAGQDPQRAGAGCAAGLYVSSSSASTSSSSPAPMQVTDWVYQCEVRFRMGAR